MKKLMRKNQRKAYECECIIYKYKRVWYICMRGPQVNNEPNLRIRVWCELRQR